MKKYLEEKLIQDAVEEYMRKENEQIEEELTQVDEPFVQMAKENRKFAKILRKSFPKKKKSRLVSFYKAATVAAAVLLVFDLFFLTVPAVRNATIGLVNYVDDQYTDMGQPTGEWATGGEENNEIAQIKPEKEYQITYLPEGMVLEDYSITYGKITYNYAGGEDKHLSFKQETKNISAGVDTEGADATPISINGTDAILIKKEEGTQIVFKLDDNVFILAGFGFSDETMIQIAESIREIQ